MNSNAPQKRKNLALDLADAEFRKEYLHSRDFKLWDILKYMYKPVLANPKICLASIGYALADGILPLFSVLIFYLLVEIIQSPGANLQQILLATGVYALLFFAFSTVATQLKNRNYTFFMRLRMQWLNQALNQYMTMDYGLYENVEFLDDFGNWDRSVSNNVQGIEGIWHRIFEMGGTVVSCLILGILLATQSPLIVIVAIVFLIVSYLIQRHVTGFRHSRREELTRVRRRTGKITEAASDFRYGKDLRLFKFSGKFMELLQPLVKTYEKLLKLFTLRSLQLSFIESLALVLIDLSSLLILINSFLQGGITLATLVMLLSAVTVFSALMQKLAESMAFVKEESMYVDDTIDFLEADLKSSGGSAELSGNGPVHVQFENVSFSYPASDKLVLDKLNLEIKPGERLALVGVNGAGKTTLVKLLTGLYLPTEGRILIDGVDSSHIEPEKLFSIFGVVFQECSPLALTVAENVAGTELDIDRERVVKSLQTAGLWEKVSSFELGIDQPLLKVVDDRGTILSGGENQKLSIARALYRDGTRCMVMDEPTAALDALAEAKIYEEFDALLSGRTALFISHRLASTLFCDRILLLDDGRIAEQGTHDELMKNGGLYQHMFTTQGKYYQEKRDEQQEERNG
ncbi:MAG: ABC transporter ATP-binding protein [Eubacteriales bacterium]|nr:ABC transporter ATP-binding protein [Eubacteriales bacterium]